jgi:hypothetical protein
MNKLSSSSAKLAKTLRQESAELESLHTGLVRHLTAWRSAHDSAVAHIAAVMARTDAIMERIERQQAAGL